MTVNFEADQAIQDWLILASNLVDTADRLETVDLDCLSGNLGNLRDALSCALLLFRFNGGVSLAERAKLRQIMNAEDPALLPYNIIKEGIMEGAQQLWATASLLRMGEPARVPADIISTTGLDEQKDGASRPGSRTNS